MILKISQTYLNLAPTDLCMCKREIDCLCCVHWRAMNTEAFVGASGLLLIAIVMLSAYL